MPERWLTLFGVEYNECMMKNLFGHSTRPRSQHCIRQLYRDLIVAGKMLKKYLKISQLPQARAAVGEPVPDYVGRSKNVQVRKEKAETETRILATHRPHRLSVELTCAQLFFQRY